MASTHLLLLPAALHKVQQVLTQCIFSSRGLSYSPNPWLQCCSSLQARAVHTSHSQPAAQQPASGSLRSDLGSGSALGSVQSQEADSSNDTAARRASLLSNSGTRFYDTVQVQPCPTPTGSSASPGYQLLLRKYPVKTPAKNIMVLPTLSLALAVAAEWEWLPSGKPAPHKMPLTGLACTAIDQPKEPARVIEHLLKYVHTDGACIR